MFYTITALVVLVIGLSVFFGYQRKVRLLHLYRGDWFEPGEPDWERLPLIRKYWDAKSRFENAHQHTETITTTLHETHALDDNTWDDLDMDRVFFRMNACLCSTGEECLYARLRTVYGDMNALKSFGAAVDYFDENRDVRARVSYALQGLGKDPYNNVCAYIYNLEGQPIRRAWMFYALAVLPFLCLLGGFVIPTFFALALVALVTNILIYYRFKFLLDMNLNSLTYIARMVGCGRVLSKAAYGALDYGTYLKEVIAPLRGLNRLSTFARKSTNDFEILFEYVKMIFMWDFIRYDRMIRRLRKHGDAFRRLYELVGEIDCAAAISAFRHTLPAYATPTFTDTDELIYNGVYHPLVSDPVVNHYNWNRNVVITGSNASGKSTFVKALALTVIGAQTLHLCFAHAYQGRPSRVITSMAARDQVYRGESYFIAEIRSLKRVMDGFDYPVRTVCFVDEILKGTNTIERIAASAAILRVLSSGNGRIIVATHDMELTELLDNLYENIHFEEQVTDEGVSFDYLLRSGAARTRNAIHLLRFTGFHEEIIRAAHQLADGFMKNRKWEY